MINRPKGCAVFHVGMPKTATKTFQMQLFAKHPDVEFLGTYIEVNSKQPWRGCRDRQVFELMDQLIWSHRDHSDFELATRLHRLAIIPAIQAGRVPVWSWESLSEDRLSVRRRRAENVAAVFGPCKILMLLRHPVHLVEALYLQLLNRDNVGAYSRFGTAVRYLPIDDWMEQNWGRDGSSPQAHLEYAETTRMYCDVFGSESVGVFLFEDLRRDPQTLIRRICRFVDIDADLGVQLMQGKEEHQRWRTQHLSRLKEISTSPLLATCFRFSPRFLRRRLLSLPKSHLAVVDGPPARAHMNDHWRDRIAMATREGNRWISEHWKLTMKEHDYPV